MPATLPYQTTHRDTAQDFGLKTATLPPTIPSDHSPSQPPPLSTTQNGLRAAEVSVVSVKKEIDVSSSSDNNNKQAEMLDLVGHQLSGGHLASQVQEPGNIAQVNTTPLFFMFCWGNIIGKHICHHFLTEMRDDAVNTLRLRQNGRYFTDIFKYIFLNENVWIWIKISLKFVPKGPINNIPSLVQIMAWRRPGDKPLSEPVMVGLLAHICVARPQWVNWHPYL